MTVLEQRTPRASTVEITPRRHALCFTAASVVFAIGAAQLGATFARPQPLSGTVLVKPTDAMRAAEIKSRAQALLRVEEDLVHCGWQHAKDQSSRVSRQSGPLSGASDDAMSTCLGRAATQRAKVEEEHASKMAAIQSVGSIAQSKNAESATGTAAGVGFAAVCTIIGGLIARAGRFFSPRKEKGKKQDTEL